MTEDEIIKIGISQKSYPQFLNKYRSDNPNTRKIFSDNELWFSNPLEFNDPYDCNTPINSHTPLADIKGWLLSVGIAPPNIDYCANQLTLNPNLMEDSAKKVIGDTGVCCFSTLEDSILQWSHYSDYHKGICLKFDITLDAAFFISPIIVSYRNVMQHYNHFNQSEKIIEYLIQPKFSGWSYESEIRIVKAGPAMIANSNKRAFKFKDEALQEVIFGTSTPPNVIEEYIELCNKNNKSHVQFYKMHLGTGVHYQLEKKPL
jgi:hypothetical protein